MHHTAESMYTLTTDIDQRSQNLCYLYPSMGLQIWQDFPVSKVTDSSGTYVLQSERENKRVKRLTTCKDRGRILFTLCLFPHVVSKNTNTPIGTPWLHLAGRYRSYGISSIS